MNISHYADQSVLEIPLPRLKGEEAMRLTGLLYDLAATLEDHYRDAIAEARRARPAPPAGHGHDRPGDAPGWLTDIAPF